MVNESYTTHEGALYEIPLDENNDAVYDVPFDLDGVYSVGVIVGNAEKSGTNKAYTVTCDVVPFNPLAADDLAPAFAIDGNYPNPFNPSTTIKFALDGTARTDLEVYDLTGRMVDARCSDHVLDAGHHEVRWNGTDAGGRTMPSGTYLAKLRSGDQVATHKLVLAK